MKLIVQIPCFNEEKTLPLVVNSIPRNIPGIDTVEILIIDDGSKDKTIEVARELGVNHIIKHTSNRGLARAFETGLDACLRLGADIIVNTDGDNQYPQEKISDLVKPILNHQAEIVIADRQTDKIKHFSPTKKFFQKLGSGMVRYLARTDVPDTVSGFRAYSKDAAMQMNIVSSFSYVIESIVQASKKNIAMTSIPVKTNPKTRESRLFKNIWQHMKKSGSTLVRMYTVYEPFKSFLLLASVLMLLGSIPGVRYIYFFIMGETEGHIQSLILSAILLIIGFQIIVLGVIGDLIGINRRLIEKIQYETKRDRYGSFDQQKVPEITEDQ